MLTQIDLLVTEPVVFFFSLWVSFAWAVLYLTFGSIPLVFGVSHNFNIQQSGAIFAAMSIGAILSTILSIYQETLLSMFLAKTNSTSKLVTTLRTPSPEGRLYFACVESAFLPIGLFWFGWTQFGHIPWIVPSLAIGCSTMGIFSIYLATFNYLADAYHRYASSALAAQSFCTFSSTQICSFEMLIGLGRNLMGGIFPLIDTALFTHLGFPGAASLLGGLVSFSSPCSLDPKFLMQPSSIVINAKLTKIRVRFSHWFHGFSSSTGRKFVRGQSLPG